MYVCSKPQSEARFLRPQVRFPKLCGRSLCCEPLVLQSSLTMCGIFGYLGPRQAKDMIVGGLQALEYRGYDSAGIAIREEGKP